MERGNFALKSAKFGRAQTEFVERGNFALKSAKFGRAQTCWNSEIFLWQMCASKEDHNTSTHRCVWICRKKILPIIYVPGEIFFLIVFTFCLVSSEVCISF